MMTRPTLLTGLLRLVLLQIRKIATILRQAGRLESPDESHSRIGWGLSRGLDHVAIGPPRHDAVLQLAGSRQIAREPDADRKQHNGDHEAGDGAATVLRLVVLLPIAVEIILGAGIIFGL